VTRQRLPQPCLRLGELGLIVGGFERVDPTVHAVETVPEPVDRFLQDLEPCEQAGDAAGRDLDFLDLATRFDVMIHIDDDPLAT
jgi:hypothetical protein